MGASTSWKPQGLYRPVMGLLYLYLYPQGLSRPVMGLFYLYLYPQGLSRPVMGLLYLYLYLYLYLFHVTKYPEAGTFLPSFMGQIRCKFQFTLSLKK